MIYLPPRMFFQIANHKMAAYRLVVTGHERRVSFECERCSGVDFEFAPTDEKLPRPMRDVRQPGMCVTCFGRGKTDSGVRCNECGGNGLCPECGGQYSRTWSELPMNAQSKLMSELERGDLSPASFVNQNTNTVADLFKRW